MQHSITLLALFVVMAASQTRANQPNIVFFFADGVAKAGADRVYKTQVRH